MDKIAYRKKAMKSLKNLPANDKEQIEQKLIEKLLDASIWKNAKTIGITLAQGFEWKTRPIIEAGWNEGKNICVPKCNPVNKALTFYELDSFEQLEVAFYNLLEPKPELTKKISKNAMELLVVPGILFDKNGYRIGFGGGYYDRFLVNYQHATASLCSTFQLVDQVPHDHYDIRVNHLITENGILSTN